MCRSLAFSECSFALVEGVDDEELNELYDKSTVFWREMRREVLSAIDRGDDKVEIDTSELDDEIAELQQECTTAAAALNRANPLGSDYDDISAAHVTAFDELQAAEKRKEEVCKKANKSRMFKMKMYWGAHQRFFRSLCVSIKVPKMLEQVKEVLDEGKCAVIGLQSVSEGAGAVAVAGSGQWALSFGPPSPHAHVPPTP